MDLGNGKNQLVKKEKTDIVNFLQNKHSKELLELGLTPELLSESINSVSSLSLQNSIFELESTSNRLYANVSGYRDDFKVDTIISQLILNEKGLVTIQERSNWLVNNCKQFLTIKNSLNQNRRIFAIDLESNSIKRISENLAQITTVIYTSANELLIGPKLNCDFKRSMSSIEAAPALTTRYTNCPIRERNVGEYYQYIETKVITASNQTGTIFDDVYVNGYLFNSYYDKREPLTASIWNEYAYKLSELVEQCKTNPTYNDNSVMINWEAIGSIQFHEARLIYGYKKYSLIPG